MNRKEAKDKRKNLGLQERKLSEKYCTHCSNKGQDVTACEGCPIFNNFRILGKQFEDITHQYRETNNIKPLENDVFPSVEVKKDRASKERWHKYKNLATANGVSRSLFNIRVNKGMHPEDAATAPVRARRFSDEQINIALSNGLSYVAIVNRVLRGWSVEKAITVPAQKRTR